MTTSTEPSALRTATNPKWIRGHLGAALVIDSRDALFVWENPHYPQWYFPIEDVFGTLQPTGEIEATTDRGDATVYDLIVGDTTLPDAARRFLDSEHANLEGRVRIEWSALDNWFEEDVEVFVHPRSPYSRTDVLPSTRHVRVHIDDTLVADSHSPTILFETDLPARYYLPGDDVRLDLLRPSATRTGCPYKGTAIYWSAAIDGKEFEDIVWSYAEPLPEAAGVAGLFCFYNERVDIDVDGRREPAWDRPT